jgi:carbonic anhydrase/acetyltransferase-like protein (isoleucine patch superfamily)
MPVVRVAHAWIADSARVTGRVTLGRDVNLWYGVVVRGDVAPISIGDRTNVQDGTILHCDSDAPLVIEADVSIGHAAVVHCASVGAGSLIGIGARVLAGAKVGRGCLVAAGALVPPGMVVPDGMCVMGLPAQVVRPVTDAERKYIDAIPPHYVGLARHHAEHPDAPDVRDWDGRPA